MSTLVKVLVMESDSSAATVAYCDKTEDVADALILLFNPMPTGQRQGPFAGTDEYYFLNRVMMEFSDFGQRIVMRTAIGSLIAKGVIGDFKVHGEGDIHRAPSGPLSSAD